MTNCKNCGAVLHSGKCEYCGTEYEVTTTTLYDEDGNTILEETTVNTHDSLNADKALERLGRAVSSFGITASEAANSMLKLQNTLKREAVSNNGK